jgi:pilus assembly protein CpaE
MNVVIMASTAEQLDRLQWMMDSSGVSLHSSSVRGEAPVWPILWDSSRCDVLVLDSPIRNQAQDLAGLGQLMSRHPVAGVLLLTDNTDPTFLLQAMRLGIREVLSRNPSAGELSESLKRLRRHIESFKAQIPPDKEASPGQGKILAFIPSKGGSGATFLSANMAYLMASEFHREVVFIDLDFHNADGTYYLSNDTHKNNISDLTQHLDRLDAHLLNSSLHPVIPGLSLLAAPHAAEQSTAITAPQLERVISLARTEHDTLVLDLHSSMDAVVVKALDSADIIYVVMENTVPHVRDTKRLIALLRSLGYSDQKLRVIVNKFHPVSDIDAVNIESTIGIRVSRSVPTETQAVVQAVNQGVPLSTIQSHNAVVRSLRELIVDELQLQAPKRKGWLNRWF